MMNKKYQVQKKPFIVPTTDGKLIEEHFGISNNSELSVAHMIAPSGWSEPFQTPEFEEYTYIIKGKKQFIIDGETFWFRDLTNPSREEYDKFIEGKPRKVYN